MKPLPVVFFGLIGWSVVAAFTSGPRNATMIAVLALVVLRGAKYSKSS